MRPMAALGEEGSVRLNPAHASLKSVDISNVES